MLRGACLLVFAIALTGCGLLESPAEKQAREARERAEEWAREQAEYQAMQQQSGSRCLSYGFYLNTPQFAMCMQTEMNNIRSQKIAQETLEVQKRAERRAQNDSLWDSYYQSLHSPHNPLNW